MVGLLGAYESPLVGAVLRRPASGLSEWKYDGRTMSNEDDEQDEEEEEQDDDDDDAE